MSDETSLPRVVFDCQVFLRGLGRGTGPAARCVELARRGAIRLYLSPDVLAEVRDVLNRPELQRTFPLLESEENVERLLAAVCRVGTVLAEVPDKVHLSRDPKDEPYLNLALAAGADFLVTADRDLLDVSTDPGEEALNLRGQLRDLTIVTPHDFVAMVDATDHSE